MEYNEMLNYLGVMAINQVFVPLALHFINLHAPVFLAAFRTVGTIRRDVGRHGPGDADAPGFGQ